MQDDIVRFYRGQCGNSSGDTLEDMWGWCNGRLEIDHDYIQWMFPSNEPSMMNRDAPTLTLEEHLEFMQDYDLQANMKKSFLRILDFYGFYLAEDGNPTLGERIVIQEIVPTDIRPDPLKWMTHFNHNMLRITRMLKSLRLTGLQNYADAFYDALRVYKNTVSPNTWGHWTKAVKDTLPFGEPSLHWRNQSPSIRLDTP